MSRNVTLLTAAVFLIATGIVSASIDYSFLERFHVNFTTLSNEVEFELQQKREFNGLLIREFNREILLEFGIMIPRMRLAHNEFIQYVMNRDAVDDECRTYVLFLADLYMFFQQYDIQDCAYLTHMQLRDDALNRFLPYEHEFSRENSRATFQVIQTLGRNRITDVDAIEFELNDELNYYMGLRQYYTELLEAELAKHGEDAHVTINMLEACIAYAFFWQDDDHEYLPTVASGNCSALVEINELFANRSAESTELVLAKWNENGVYNGVLNELIVLNMGEMVHRMRKVNAETYLLMREAQGLDEECQEYLEWYYELMVSLQTRDVQLCGIYAYSDVVADGIARFRPRARYLLRMNSRALHQVVCFRIMIENILK